MESVAVGSSVKELCEKGDNLLLEETGKVSLSNLSHVLCWFNKIKLLFKVKVIVGCY